MRCPAHDGELHIHSSTNANGLTVTFAQCPMCRSTWMTSFDANYATLDIVNDLPDSSLPQRQPPYHCPICKDTLTQAHQESVAPGVVMYQCSNGDGYYFPNGQFTNFKRSQTVKLEYFKLWKIPFGSPLSTLLTTLVGLILSAGLIASTISTGTTQVTTSKASEIIRSQQAYSSTAAITVIALTTRNTALTLHIPEFNNFAKPLQTTDGLSHVIRVTGLTPGTYRYYFTFDVDGQTIQSEEYTVTVE